MTNRAFLQSALLKDTVVLNIEADSSSDAIKAACLAALPPNLRAPDLEVFDESETSDDGNADLEAAETAKTRGQARRLHIGRCKRVSVKVRYAGRSVERKFSPAATIERVKNWAARELQIAKQDATELALQLAGSDVQPPRDKHVGCFVGKSCDVVFDLVRAYTVNGDSQLPADHAAVLQHLETGAFLSGVDDGRWSLKGVQWPYLLLDIRAINGDLYTLRLRCDGYPALPPTGAFWDVPSNSPLPAARWPRAGAHRGQALRADWQSGTALYIPCDRSSISGHDQWTQLYPAWLWDATVGLTRYLNVVSELLNGSDYVSPSA